MSHDLWAMKSRQKGMVWALVALRNITRRAAQDGSTPDFRKLARLINYVERVAERQHQTNEERHLFRRIETRQPALASSVARLRRDHVAMKGYRVRLAEALSYWQKGDPRSAKHAPVVAQDYLDFCERHVRAERDLLQALRRAVSVAEWSAMERDFDVVDDPLAKAQSRHEREAALERFD